jgi:hypothetical protein
MNSNISNQGWYNKTYLVVILCIVFFPVGLYALWKNQFVSKGWKIGVSIFFLILVISQIGNTGKYTENAQELINTSAPTQNQEQSEEVLNMTETENNSSSNSEEKNEEQSEDMYNTQEPCIGESQAKDKVSEYLKQQVLEGTLDATWMPHMWKAEQQSVGWIVEALLFTEGGGNLTMSYFVSCDGQVQ